MSNDPEFDRYADEILEVSRRNTARWPDDPEWTDENWQARVRRLLRFIYRTGARAQLDHGLRRQVDPVDRVRWLADNGFMAGDIIEVVREVEDLREKAGALQGRYGVTDSDIRSMLSEGFHTAFRKAVDSPYAAVIHKLIRDMEDGEYGSVIDFVADPLIAMLREAEVQAEVRAEAVIAGVEAEQRALWPASDPELVQAMMRWAMSKGATITREWFGLPPAEKTAEDQETTA